MTDALDPPAPPVRRSTFVTVLAWLGIVGFSCAALMFAAEALVLRPIVEQTVMTQLTADSLGSVNPEAAEISAAMMPYAFLAFVVFALVGVGASIGLLRRRNWGRILVIVYLAFGIIGAVFGLLGGLIMGSMPKTVVPAGVSSAQFDQMMGAMRFLMMGGSVVVALLCAWLIYKLLSKPIQAEFVPDGAR
jgi:hypothetical protein